MKFAVADYTIVIWCTRNNYWMCVVKFVCVCMCVCLCMHTYVYVLIN